MCSVNFFHEFLIHTIHVWYIYHYLPTFTIKINYSHRWYVLHFRSLFKHHWGFRTHRPYLKQSFRFRSYFCTTYHINITKKTPHVYSTKKHPPRNSTNDLPQKTLPNNPQSGNKNQSMGGVVHPPLHPLPPHCPISSPAMDQTWVPWWG